MDSVLNQTYKDFEIILIDDGSTDSTPQICDEYGQKYDFIHVFHQENIGLSKTREKLLEKASGKYIFWLDSDDYYDKTLLEKSMDTFDTSLADIVAWGRNVLLNNEKQMVNPIEELGVHKWRQLNLWGIVPAVWMYASKRELWEDIERFPNDIDLVDDVWLTAQIIAKTKNIVSLGECLYYYDATNSNSITHAYTGKKLCRDAMAFYRIIKTNQRRQPNNIYPLSLRLTRSFFNRGL